ncbi:MAG: hypothetical protein WCR53_05965, partial [Bacteroidaceae bacterium]
KLVFCACAPIIKNENNSIMYLIFFIPILFDYFDNFIRNYLSINFVFCMCEITTYSVCVQV